MLDVSSINVVDSISTAPVDVVTNTSIGWDELTAVALLLGLPVNVQLIGVVPCAGGSKLTLLCVAIFETAFAAALEYNIFLEYLLFTISAFNSNTATLSEDPQGDTDSTFGVHLFVIFISSYFIRQILLPYPMVRSISTRQTTYDIFDIILCIENTS